MKWFHFRHSVRFDGNDFKGCTPHPIFKQRFSLHNKFLLRYMIVQMFAVVKLVTIKDALILFLFAEAGIDGLFTDLVGSSLIASDIYGS